MINNLGIISEMMRSEDLEKVLNPSHQKNKNQKKGNDPNKKKDEYNNKFKFFLCMNQPTSLFFILFCFS